MTDVINTNSFEYVDGSASAGLTVDNDKSTLTWKIGDISKDSKSVSFKIKLKEDNTADGSLKTNSNVSLTFQSNKLNKEVTFNKGAIGDPTVDVYKVTYTDGVPDKEIFADQTTCNLVSGDPTPDFDGTIPTREGYTFSGWSPDWSSTVTETVTYEAQWTLIPQYTVTYDLNGGTGTTPDSATGYENTSVTVANDEKFENPGYTFSGWNTEENGTGTDYAAGSSLILARNVTLYAQWNPSENTQYKVEHYWQNVENDEYTLHETQTLSGTTGTETAAEANTYPGFTAKSFEQSTIAADGSTVVKIYYDRNKYTIYYQITGDNLTEKNTIVADDGKKYFKIVNDVKYGAETALITDNMDVGGYLWSGWSGLIGESMPAQDVYVTGSYSPATDTKYTVHHYIQNVDLNGYTEAQSSPVTLTGVTGETTNATAWNITGFTAQSFAQQEIQANGSTVIDIYYNRNLHKVTYQITGNYFTSDSYIVQENIPYGQALSLISDEMGKTGYTWSGWGGLPQTMPDNDVTVTGSYTANANTQYKVEHYQQNLDGTYPDSPTTTETLYGTTGTEVTATPNEYEGFTYDGDAAGTVASGTILGDGTLVLKLFYSRNTHKVTYNLNGGTGATGGDYAETTYRYGQKVTVQPAPTRDYRQFQGWQRDNSQNKVEPNSTFTMPDNDVNFTATWDAENYNVEVDKTSNANNPAKLGDKINYTVKVSNNGNMVMNDVTVTDSLWGSGKVTAVSVSDEEKDVSQGSYTIGSLNPRQSIQINYTYTVTQDDVKAGEINNTVTASDGNNHKGSSTLETPVNPRYTITIKYVDSEGNELQKDTKIPLESGETYSYDVSYASGATIPYALSGNYIFSHFTEDSILSGTLEKDVTITAVYTIGAVYITPADITLYQGGKGYGGIVDGTGEPAETTNSNGLPEPGYYIQLGADLNTALREALGEEDNAVIDLSKYVTFTYNGTDGQTRTWTLEKYDKDGSSTVSDGRYIYRIVPAQGQQPVRLEITDPENDNKIVLNDDFETDLLDGGSIYKKYTTSIYPGDLEQSLVKLVIQNTDSALDGNAYPLEVQSGAMTVRGTTENSGTALIGQEGTAENGAAEGFTASVPSGTTYTVNGSQIGLNDSSGVALLVDDLLSEGVTGNDGEDQQLITDVIQEKSIQAIKAENSDFETTDQTRYEMRYMNLVDTNNGDVYVTATDKNGDNASVTISWPMPKDADKNGKFYIVHFDGMAREYDSTVDLLSDIEKWDQIDVVEGKVNGDSISFTTDSFSPFILVWEEENTSNPGGSTGGGTTPNPPALNTEDHFSYVVGYEDGMVKPENAITRAEVASIFYRLLKDDVRDANTTDVSEFSDVSASDWYGTTVATLSAMDIVRGYEDGTFRPNAPITRAEFAAIATRFFEETGAEYEPGTFDDVTGNEWFANAIADAVELGLIGGYPDGTVRPNNNITRAEACAIVNRTLGRIPHVDHLLPADEMTTWPDNNPSDWFYADMQEATNGHEYEWTTEQGQKVEEWTEILDKDWEDR